MVRRYRKVLPRRTFLRGAGTVAIALPFLDEMRSHSVWARPPEPAVRALNVFFGLGVYDDILSQGYDDALAPLASVSDKFALVRGLTVQDWYHHQDGGAHAFTGMGAEDDGSRARGPSVDQVIKQSVYPSGPGTLVDTLMMGSFFRRSFETRYVHCWNADGLKVGDPIETPELLFERIFGSGEAPTGPKDLTPEQIRARHYRKSALDTVVEEYRHFSSDNSPLGAVSKARVADHLDKVRELEKRLFTDIQLDCSLPKFPGGTPLLQGQGVDEVGPEIHIDDWSARWRALVDLYALAMHCDVARFGMAMFSSGGERVRLRGDYEDLGFSYTFDDQSEHHNYFHSFNGSQTEPGTNGHRVRAHVRYVMSNLRYLFEQLDDPLYQDEDGRTFLENACVVLTCEEGSSAHELSRPLTMVSSANGRFRTGEILDVDYTTTDFYRTVSEAMGGSTAFGDDGNTDNRGTLTELLA